MSGNLYTRYALTGGTEDALDGIDGGVLKDSDVAIVFDGGYAHIFYLDPNSIYAESSPDYIAPDTNPGTKKWTLTNTGGGFILRNGFGEAIANIKTSGLVRDLVRY